jgi:hypothetical protein
LSIGEESTGICGGGGEMLTPCFNTGLHKSEIRISKSETNPNFPNPNDSNNRQVS